MTNIYLELSYGGWVIYSFSYPWWSVRKLLSRNAGVGRFFFLKQPLFQILRSPHPPDFLTTPLAKLYWLTIEKEMQAIRRENYALFLITIVYLPSAVVLLVYRCMFFNGSDAIS